MKKDRTGGKRKRKAEETKTRVEGKGIEGVRVEEEEKQVNEDKR